MSFLPKVKLAKSGDRLTVFIRQKYRARGNAVCWRWRVAGMFSLRELKKEEKNE